MNSHQLETIGNFLLNEQSHYRPELKFFGVFPRDKAPACAEVASYPACLIVNADNSNEAGSHWLALLYVTAMHAEFFDSYGLKPEFYSLEHLLPSATNAITDLSVVQLQSDDSDVCGHYCIYFLFERAKCIPFHRIFNQFSLTNFIWNDTQVTRIVEHNLVHKYVLYNSRYQASTFNVTHLCSAHNYHNPNSKCICKQKCVRKCNFHCNH